MSGSKKRVVVFISGSGSNMVKLAEACQAPDFPAEIVAVIADKPDAGGLQKAAALGLETFVFPRKQFDSKAAHEAAMLTALAALNPDIICLAGFMRILSGDFIRAHEGRIINIHPSLLPLFPGLHTHQRAIDSGMRIAGCSVHFVTEGMDEGPVIGQAAVPIIPGDDADTLAARILTVEHQLYPAVLKCFAEGKVWMEDDKAVFSGDSTAGTGQQLIVG
ncbi:phosphoribosylglycinamide formyltransferase [Martelella sp. HB161492]|uniref:phosphoribosylglycinamide formyltransferase n=1 Tax=Martelella sp. HB161492 TaxID=2720726 RepID=UPI0015909C35|nr:phosphoribosylglycinamide formyltransferase [Martelella sp. HB161492]